ncbi:MAG: TIR domain-containing protein [Butyrivibrio sp.]|nr:TIR domain-containing protein [Butyrivibrio sp.]
MSITISYDILREQFSSLQSEGSREYELALTKYAELIAKNDGMGVLKELIDSDLDCAYEAFYCLCIIYRRNKDFELFKALLDDNVKFQNRITYNHLVVQYLVNSETFYDFDSLLNMAYSDTKVFDGNAGYLQAFCNAFATILDQCDEMSKEDLVKDWYDVALDCINKAIELDPNYAKYYCTKARIISLKNDFVNADKLINMAISKEKSSRPDYVLTIQNYQYYRAKIMIQKSQYEIEKKLSLLQQKIDELQMYSSEKDAADRDDDRNEPHAYEGNSKYSFVSYAHTDKTDVYSIIGKLQKKSINIWFDEGIQAGEEWPEVVAKRIVDSDTVLVMLSSNSIQSANVRREVNLAISENKTVIVVRLDEVPLSPGMKLQFSLYQMVNRDSDDERFLVEKLASAIMMEEGNG